MSMLRNKKVKINLVSHCLHALHRWGWNQISGSIRLITDQVSAWGLNLSSEIPSFVRVPGCTSGLYSSTEENSLVSWYLYLRMQDLYPGLTEILYQSASLCCKWEKTSPNSLNNKRNVLAHTTEVEVAAGEPCSSRSNDTAFDLDIPALLCLRRCYSNPWPPCHWLSSLSLWGSKYLLLHYIIYEDEGQRCFVLFFRKKQLKIFCWVLTLVGVYTISEPFVHLLRP